MNQQRSETPDSDRTQQDETSRETTDGTTNKPAAQDSEEAQQEQDRQLESGEENPA